MQLTNLSLFSQYCFLSHFTPKYPQLTCLSTQPYIHISTSAFSVTGSSSTTTTTTTTKKHILNLLSSITKTLLTHTLACFWRKQSCIWFLLGIMILQCHKYSWNSSTRKTWLFAVFVFNAMIKLVYCPFHKRLVGPVAKSSGNEQCFTWKILTKSYHNSAHTTTARVSCKVQNYDLIWSPGTKLEHTECYIMRSYNMF